MSDPLPDLASWNCFACGQDHPKGLRLRFTGPEQDRIRSEFEISTDHTGLGDVVHGGVVATVSTSPIEFIVLPVPIAIDIKPDSDDNPINPSSRGVLRVDQSAARPT